MPIQNESTIIINFFSNSNRERVWRLWYKLSAENTLLESKDYAVPSMNGVSINSPRGVLYTFSTTSLEDLLLFEAGFSVYLTKPVLSTDETKVISALLAQWKNSRTGRYKAS